MRAHISIDVKDIPGSTAFYRRVFGVEPQKQAADYAKFDLTAPALNFSMQSRPGRPASRVGHFGIEVDSPEELSRWQERLEAAGFLKRVETQTACCFARQDKLWTEDPDGNAWEVFYVHEQLPVHASASLDGQCCP
ncbi:MAG TPA: ArsI/CadI family heavy metal resistance metalloenzyme [bacterium]|nr:ArsI/CadI family heavy metal resistance metalloenzyme [bacterium]